MSDAKYFHTTKRGEIHELKEELHQLDKTKKKEAVKKVVFLAILPVIASFLLNLAFCDFSWMYVMEKALLNFLYSKLKRNVVKLEPI